MDDELERTSASDEIDALTAAAAAGDRSALDALVERYVHELHAFVRLRLGGVVRARESTMDIVQSAVREVIENRERFVHPNEAAFKRWLFVTAMRKIQNRHDHYTAAKREEEVRAEPIDDAASERLLVHYRRFSSPSHALMLREEIARIEDAFSILDDEEREAVTLAHLVGLSRREIGEQLGRSEGAVRVMLHRALVKIAERLDDRRA